MELDIINPNCAGIDIGSKSHYVAVGQALEDVKEFGVYADDLTAICLHLLDRCNAGIRIVRWITLVHHLHPH